MKALVSVKKMILLFYMVHRPVTEKIGNGFAIKDSRPRRPSFLMCWNTFKGC